MFNITPTSHSGGLRRSRSYAELPPWTPEFPFEHYLFDSIPELDDSDDEDMEPVSPLSPTSSEASLTPTTPTDYSHLSKWRSPVTPIRRPSPPMLNTVISSALIECRKSSFHSGLASPVLQSFAERAAQRRSPLRTRNLSTICEEVVVSEVEQARSRQSEVDYDGDMEMLSPPTNTFREDSWELDPTVLDHVQVETNNGSIIPISCLEKPQLIEERESHTQSITLPPSQRQYRTRRHSRTSIRVPKLHITDPTIHQLKGSIAHLATPLVPLVSVTSGLAHPEFPRSILQYHLLTHDQLDSLARWYHQTIDNNHEKHMYPAVINGAWCFSNEHRMSLSSGPQTVDLVAKRRRFGRFIGLRGCESPVVDMEEIEEGQRVEDIQERMEREWRAALRRAEEEERVREKVWRGRF